MRLRFLLNLIMVLTSLSAFAQKPEVKTITAEATYPARFSESETSGCLHAREMAILEGLQKEFNVTMSGFTEIRDRTGHESQGTAITASTVRGECLEIIKEDITPTRTEHGINYHAKVKFLARAIERDPDPIDVRLLYGPDPERCIVKNQFVAGDNFYLYVKSPVDGYLTVYIRDDDEYQTMQAILPYEGKGGEAYQIKADTPYIFFSKADAEPEMALACRPLKLYSRKSADINTVFVLFSRTPFTRPATNKNKTAEVSVNISGEEINLMPRETKYRDFQKWRNKLLSQDPYFQSIERLFEVEKRQ